MSSHWDWAERKIKDHDDQKPFAPENGQPLKFKAGDVVIFTNDYGVEFERTVTGLYLRGKDDCMYATGYRYTLDKDAHWMPVKEANLRIKSEVAELLPL